MFPHLQHCLSPGFNGQPEPVSFINRTGAVIPKGTPVMVDVAGSATEATSEDPSSSEFNDQGVVTCTQAGINAGFPIVVALDDVADDTFGNFCVAGRVEVATLNDDTTVDNTTDVDVGDPISILVSSSAVAVQGYDDTNNHNRILGIAREEGGVSAADPASRVYSTAAHFRWVIWWGGLYGSGFGYGT